MEKGLREDQGQVTAWDLGKKTVSSRLLEFDSTLGHLGEGPTRVPYFGSVETCTDCDLTPCRECHVVEMQESAREIQKCEKKRDRDGEVQGMCDVPQP